MSVKIYAAQHFKTSLRGRYYFHMYCLVRVKDGTRLPTARKEAAIARFKQLDIRRGERR
jgi:hypothetical protein